MSREHLFYEVSALDESRTPDVLRSAWHDALDTLSYFVRACPTLPSDPSDSRKPLRCALDTDKALYLPLKHCAFDA